MPPTNSPPPASAGPNPHPRSWHALGPEEVLGALSTGPDGLSTAEAARRLALHGPNRLPAARPRGALIRFLAQFHNLLIYILIGAGVIAAAIGHGPDAIVIFGVVLLNAVIGYIQEGRAERALDAIRRMIDPRASVLRGGRRTTVPADELVPGDIVLLEAGDRVPADLRLLSARSLKADEAAITGESVPADKTVEAAPDNAPLGDRVSMAFSGTFIAAGHGTGVVTETAGATELGRISSMIGAVEQLTTPLVGQMNVFARQITIAVLGVSALVFLYAVALRAYSLDEAFMVVVGLAVAAIPEGLPAVMTIALAVGVQRMARRKAIIRRLPAVETLGAVSVICSDKTGTLTRNEMTVKSVVAGEEEISVSGTGYAPVGEFETGGKLLDPAADPALARLARASLLCNDAHLNQDGETWSIDGDPMEAALLCFAEKAGYDAPTTRHTHERLDEIPFDARHRYMATLHQQPDGSRVVYVKGAPERILAMCDKVLVGEGGGVEETFDAAGWHHRTERLASEGQRVLAIACRMLPERARTLRAPDVERGLTLLGLVGLIDPPRKEVLAAIAECRAAGVGVKMITGDHKATALAIARQLGLSDDPQVVTGQELDAMEAEDLAARARTASVFARASPEHKLRLVEALQADGSVIAMTGDGVNDAPALKRADVGVAMGAKGTEAAKEAAEMVLTDDNFASIVAAVREGRTVYDNLTKVIAWTLPTNGGEAMLIILAIVFGLTLPVTPVQILWINLVTAVALGLTIAFEPTEPNAMQRPPCSPKQGLISKRLLWRVLFVSGLMVAGGFGLYASATARGLPLEVGRTIVVNAIVAMEIFYLFSVRYVHGPSITWQGVLGTRAVLIGVASVLLAQLAFTYLPVMQRLFGSHALSIVELAAIVAVGVAFLLIVEAEKRIAESLMPMKKPKWMRRYGRPRPPRA
ncbi:putative cation-transporting ATPase F [Methyloligella halotolerans]|uniref:Putative cation-transporting ATPase F n=1 Tax=Methyloligella halotolerans TaxID=1177755 RepID=A0A1E2RX75_9HYPH|nr:cation-transporting P-type ATPase [Methyloligella halotolerans]ODA66698.1 putative cation-transporting ATPase F [Methyloligella halotolerans]